MAKSKLTRIRELFKAEGFEYHKEFMKALQDADPQTRLEALVSVAPFFMERLKPEPEIDEKPVDVTPTPKQIKNASEADLLRALNATGKSNKG